MKETLEKALNLSLGALVYSKEKISEFADELVQKGEMKKEEAGEWVDRLAEKGEAQRKEIKDYIDRQIVARSAEFATKEDIRQIVREELAREQAQETPQEESACAEDGNVEEEE